MTGSGKERKPATRLRQPPKLDDVSDAPESGEPLEQGRSRGRRVARD